MAPPIPISLEWLIQSASQRATQFFYNMFEDILRCKEQYKRIAPTDWALPRQTWSRESEQRMVDGYDTWLGIGLAKETRPAYYTLLSVYICIRWCSTTCNCLMYFVDYVYCMYYAILAQFVDINKGWQQRNSIIHSKPSSAVVKQEK